MKTNSVSCMSVFIHIKLDMPFYCFFWRAFHYFSWNVHVQHIFWYSAINWRHWHIFYCFPILWLQAITSDTTLHHWKNETCLRSRLLLYYMVYCDIWSSTFLIFCHVFNATSHFSPHQINLFSSLSFLWRMSFLPIPTISWPWESKILLCAQNGAIFTFHIFNNFIYLAMFKLSLGNKQ